MGRVEQREETDGMADGLDLDPRVVVDDVGQGGEGHHAVPDLLAGEDGGAVGGHEDIELGRDEVEQVDGELLGVLERKGRVLVVDPCIYCIV